VAWLNYQHLYYFWMVARSGSITLAARELRLTQPTISTQLHLLEEHLGEKLFERAGRRLALTDMGRLALEYADDIFALGRDLQTAIARKERRGGPLRVAAGVTNVFPKLIAHQLLAPVYLHASSIKLTCREDHQDRLLAELALHELDFVLCDAPVGTAVKVRVFNHLLGESQMALYGAPTLIRKFKAPFPALLNGAPVLLPMEYTSLRRSVDEWMLSRELRPQVVGEFGDSALLKEFGRDGSGLFVAALALQENMRKDYGCELVGRLDGVVSRYYAISGERRVRNPALASICRAARLQFRPTT
jgi:LysR family transcriptional activator of nhaA